MVPTTFNQKRVFGHKSTAMRTSCYPFGQVVAFTSVIQCLLLFFRQTMQTFFCHISFTNYLNIFEYNGNQFTNQSYIKIPNTHSQPMVEHQTKQTIYNHPNQPILYQNLQTNQTGTDYSDYPKQTILYRNSKPIKTGYRPFRLSKPNNHTNIQKKYQSKKSIKKWTKKRSRPPAYY